MTSKISIIPQPIVVNETTGAFSLTADTVVVADPPLHVTAEQIAAFLRPATGYNLPVQVESSGKNVIRLRLDKDLVQLGEEGYLLDVTPSTVELTSADDDRSLLLRPDAASTSAGGNLQRFRSRARLVDPGVHIEDAPRFGWRGAMLDVGRHFMPKEFVLKFIDLLALHKMNIFHWHLTEDQGWRVEIKRYPRLTTHGSMRSATPDRPPP